MGVSKGDVASYFYYRVSVARAAAAGPGVRGSSGTVLLTERDAAMYSEAEVARFLEMTTSSINRLAISEERPEFRKYRNAL